MSKRSIIILAAVVASSAATASPAGGPAAFNPAVVPAATPAPAPALSSPAPASSIVTVAAGGKAAGDACAAKLSPESKLIYDATVKNLGATASLKDVVTTQTRSLVMQGKVQRSTAKASAEATAPCLELVAKG